LQRHDFRQQAAAGSAHAILESLHATFASRFSSALGKALSIHTQITYSHADSLHYGEFLASRCNPTCLSVLRIEPVGAQICFEIAPVIAFPLIDRLLGGRGEVPQPPSPRRLTQMEQGLALQIIERAAAALADTWSSAGIDSVREEAVFIDPSDARLMPQDEMVSVVTFDVSFQTFAGPVSLCLPAPVTNLLAGVAPADRTAVRSDPSRDSENLAQNVMQSAVELRALLAETKLRLNEVLALAEGDIITTDTPIDALMTLRLRDQDILHGRIAQFHGQRAIEIASPAGGQHKA
jgi:flagellar motor switch protein FliM